MAAESTDPTQDPNAPRQGAGLAFTAAGLTIIVVGAVFSVLPPHSIVGALIGIVGALCIGVGVVKLAGSPKLLLVGLIVGALLVASLTISTKTVAREVVGETIVCEVTSQDTETTRGRRGRTRTSYVHQVSCPNGEQYEITTGSSNRQPLGPVEVIYDPNDLIEPDFADRHDPMFAALQIIGTLLAQLVLILVAWIMGARKLAAAQRAAAQRQGQFPGGPGWPQGPAGYAAPAGYVGAPYGAPYPPQGHPGYPPGPYQR